MDNKERDPTFRAYLTSIMSSISGCSTHRLMDCVLSSCVSSVSDVQVGGEIRKICHFKESVKVRITQLRCAPKLCS